MRIVTYTTLYPNAAQPHHGIFVEQRLRHVRARGGVELRVVAPVPWFPFRQTCFREWAAYARAPRVEERAGVTVQHPRYPAIPVVGMTLAPLFLAGATLPVVRRLRTEGFDFDLIDAHYFYPDGVAAAWIAGRVGRPVVITARGTDINLIPRYALPRRMILWAAGRAAAIVTVCQALKNTLIELGAEPGKIEVLRNGVDLELFRPLGRDAERARLRLTRRTLLSVGLLIERKGHHLAIEALAQLPEVDLLIVGHGPEEERLRALAARLGVSDRVRFVGPLPQHELPRYYTAADALVLASSREGWANVLLEAMACGTPVIASNVWGTPEVVRSRDAGVLMPERSAAGVAQAYRDLFADHPNRAATRRYAEQFNWDATTAGQLALFRRVIEAHGRR